MPCILMVHFAAEMYPHFAAGIPRVSYDLLESRLVYARDREIRELFVFLSYKKGTGGGKREAAVRLKMSDAGAQMGASRGSRQASSLIVAFRDRNQGFDWRNDRSSFSFSSNLLAPWSRCTF